METPASIRANRILVPPVFSQRLTRWRQIAQLGQNHIFLSRDYAVKTALTASGSVVVQVLRK
jgi:hypothetical protein